LFHFFFKTLDLFTIGETNFVRNIAPFDRESSYFEGYQKPLIQIKLNLNCPATLLLTNITAFSESEEVEEIFFSKTMTYLNIIILDQNDNAPIITNPPIVGFSVGFPDAKLAEKLIPKHLIQIEADDKDEGINAEIKYSLLYEDHFTIDEDSGIIYPLKSCMVDVLTINVHVTATDRNGAADGNSESTMIVVNKVSSENVVVLRLENEVLRDVEEIVEELSEDSGLDIRVINYYFAVQENEIESKQVNVESKIVIFAYAYSENSDLLYSEEIVEALSGADMISVTSYEYYDKPSDCSLTGLIVGVSVLGSLLLLIVIGLPLIWFLWFRYKIKESSKRNSVISTNKLEEDFNAGSEGRSSPIAAVVNENESPASSQSDAEILGIQIEGATQGELLKA
jgi:hypothetical protein